MNEELLHYSAKPFGGPVHSEKQESAGGFKPRGFWLSVGDAWVEWCRGEDWNLGCIVHVARITLSPSANILRLASQDDLDRFTEKYGEQDGRLSFRHINIRWDRVAEKYDGIIISPYVWERRLELMWYYGWDCASGCIWNADAIQSVDVIGERVEDSEGQR